GLCRPKPRHCRPTRREAITQQQAHFRSPSTRVPIQNYGCISDKINQDARLVTSDGLRLKPINDAKALKELRSLLSGARKGSSNPLLGLHPVWMTPCPFRELYPDLMVV